MKNSKILSAIALIGVFFFTACEKEESMGKIQENNQTKEYVVKHNKSNDNLLTYSEVRSFVESHNLNTPTVIKLTPVNSSEYAYDYDEYNDDDYDPNYHYPNTDEGWEAAWAEFTEYHNAGCDVIIAWNQNVINVVIDSCD